MSGCCNHSKQQFMALAPGYGMTGTAVASSITTLSQLVNFQMEQSLPAA